jgi:hypothetical protein
MKLLAADLHNEAPEVTFAGAPTAIPNEHAHPSRIDDYSAAGLDRM